MLGAMRTRFTLAAALLAFAALAVFAALGAWRAFAASAIEAPPRPAQAAPRSTPAAAAAPRSTPAAATAFDAAAYDRYRQPDALVAALGLSAGQSVADVGAGRGYLTTRLARAVGPRGRVVATEVDAAALDALARLPRPADAAPIVARRVAADDPGLEQRAYDLILLAEVDHLLGDRAAYLARLGSALAPGGRVAVSNRRSYRAALVAAAARAGFVVARESDALPAHFLIVLEPAR
jgi:predicted methyltransferase